MATAGTSVIDVEARVAARPETVFSFLNSAEGMQRWFGRSVDLDARPGGRLRVDVNGRDIAGGEVVEVEPNKRIVFTFGWEGENHPVPVGSTTVEITLTPDGDGTLIRLEHRDLPADAAGDHKEGWQHYMDRLVELAEGRDPGKDPWSEREME